MSDNTAVDTAEDSTADVPAVYRMTLDVKIQSTGPCRRHVLVRVPEADLNYFRGEIVKEFSGQAQIRGFRTGKVPTALLQRQFRKEIGEQVRQRVLLQSLEQLSEDNQLDPINEPNFDLDTLQIPDTGDFEYEFDVEVRPDFELPSYAGLKITRPVREITDADVEAHIEKFLHQFVNAAKVEEPAQLHDLLDLEIEFFHNGQPVRKIRPTAVPLRPLLRLQDVELANFGELLQGASAGEVRETQAVVSPEAERVELRGEQVTAKITVLTVKRFSEEQRHNFQSVGYESEDDLRAEIRGMLMRQLQFEQRQAARAQVLEKITESATWDLPEELVRKQVENALRREILEMQQAGFTAADIRARENELRQNSLTSTRQALKEHFVLDRIATQEAIESTPVDVESEIAMMAVQSGETPRKVRARLQKSGLVENLEAQIRERKAIDHILSTATYEDVPAPPSDAGKVAAIPFSLSTQDTLLADDATGSEE